MERLRLRKEVINEFFFVAPVRNPDGTLCPAPQEALEKYRKLRENWLLSHPKLAHEFPHVALEPVNTPERVGYLVATRIFCI